MKLRIADCELRIGAWPGLITNFSLDFSEDGVGERLRPRLTIRIGRFRFCLCQRLVEVCERKRQILGGVKPLLMLNKQLFMDGGDNCLT
jgi:hypothetical protein